MLFPRICCIGVRLSLPINDNILNHPSHIEQLLQQLWSQDDKTAAYEALQQLLRDDPASAAVIEAALAERPLPGELRAYQRAEWEHTVDAVLRMDEPVMAPPKRVRRLWPYWSAAAAVVLLAGVALYQLRPAKVTPIIVAVNDARPASAKATLTMADGQVVTLDSTGARDLSQNGAVVRQQGGRLLYGNGSAVSYNTLQTPRGGQFQLQLPDGTEVWLNAASSIRFPTAFAGKERLVEVTGEVYMEVARNADQPFRVKVNEQVNVQVLGTRFNINAYGDEKAIQTTLVQGAVKVESGSAAQILQPGQQAQVSDNIRVVPADVEQVTAWKNGLFNFHNMELKEVMRQLSRWYDIDIEYRGTITPREFWGKMGRNLTLSEVLKGLEGAGINFKIEENGKKLVVLP
jgi:transmembrane sensor